MDVMRFLFLLTTLLGAVRCGIIPDTGLSGELQRQSPHEINSAYDAAVEATQAPDHGTHNPNHHTHDPGHGTHHPPGHTHDPGHGTHHPPGHTHDPGHGTHHPPGHTHDPGHGTHHPPGHTHDPDHGTHHPPGHTHDPGHGTHHPPGHTDHPPGHGGGHSMMMYFHSSEHATILFKEWHTMTWQELLGSCIGIAVIAALYEGFKILRDWLGSKRREKYSRVCPTSANGGVEMKGGYEQNIVKHGPLKLSPWDSIHVIQSLLHVIQLFLSYCLMLVVMTFNAYLVIAVCLGAAIGYFCFAWKKFTVQDQNECCN